MDEPYKAKDEWWRCSQTGIDGVRASDKNTMIIVGGYGFSGTKDWEEGLNRKLPEMVKDPSNNLCYEGHCYFDHRRSGLYKYAYEYEINRPYAVVNPKIGVERIRPFVEWLEETGNRGLLGEFSVPANSDRDPR